VTTLVLVNRSSGSAEAVLDEVHTSFAGAEIVECEPDEIADRAQHSKADVVAVAGGDGTIRSVAEVFADTDKVLVPVPGGTLNHFARTLGIETVADAAAAVDGNEVRVDVGCVAGRAFVNNSSVGFYPGLVRRREARESTLPKWIAAIVAMWHACWTERDLTVRIDEHPVRVWLVFVGNNCYGDNLRDLGSRTCIDEGVLDVGVVRADRRFARLRLIAAILLGRLHRSPVVDRFTSEAIEVAVDGQHDVDVALDGEVVQLRSPLRYEVRPKALRVRVPAG
jgi:undecaprenyl-diphosphatase